MAGWAVYRALNRTPLASTYRGKLMAGIVAGALPAPAAVCLWAVLVGPVAPGVIVLVLACALLGTALAALVVSALLAPVERAAAVAAAALEGRTPAPAGGDLADRLLSDVTRLAGGGYAAARSTSLAPVTDPLTGLRNRHWCETRLADELGRGAREDFVLALIDVCGLRRINESHGRAAGDACLQSVARITRETLRTGDWLARWGGDEFLAVLRGGREEARAALDRLRARVAETHVVEGGDDDGHLSVTIGAVACTGEEPVDALFRSADRAVAAARIGRSGRVAFFGDR